MTNSLRLLKLPHRVRQKIIAGELTEGHARALLGAGDAGHIEELAEKVIRGKLTVRATEALVRAKMRGKKKAGRDKSSSVRDLEAKLTRALGTRVVVRDRGNKGEVAIPY